MSDRQQFTINVNGRPVVVTLRFNAWLCRKLGLVGFVYRDTLSFAGPATAIPAWVIAHELVHVWQWRTHGSWWGHVWRYVQCIRKWGYLNCPYEREAIRHQGTVRTGVLVAIGVRSTADYLRHDGRSSVATTAFTGLQAPFLATWVSDEVPTWSRWPSPTQPVRWSASQLPDKWEPAPTAYLEDGPQDDFDWMDVDPGTTNPFNNDREDDGA